MYALTRPCTSLPEVNVTTAFIKRENVYCSETPDWTQAAFAEKLEDVLCVQQFASVAGQVEHADQSVLATVNAESALHVSAICHQQNHLQQI